MAPAYRKYTTIAICLAASALGGYTTIGTMLTNGLSEVLSTLASDPKANLPPPAPVPFKHHYTGIPALDAHLVLLVGFFSSLVDGSAPAHLVFYVWSMAQFAAGWTLLCLEAARAGNRRIPLVGWAGVVGVLFQNTSWTITVPLYLALHLSLSPAARLTPADGPAARRALFAYLWDMAVLPTATTLSFLVPAVLMAVPGFGSAATHYNLLALWQFFPLVSVGIQGALHALGYAALGSLQPVDGGGRPTSRLGTAYMVAVAGVYQFCLTLTVGTHVPIVLLSVAPDAVRGWLVSTFFSSSSDSSWAADLIQDVRFRDVFVPRGVLTPPTVDASAYGSGDLAPLTTHFLQYDFYVAGVAFLLWAVYLRQIVVKRGAVVGLVGKVLGWVVVGGPHAAVVALLWERDGVVLLGEGDGKEKEKEGRGKKRD